MTQWVDFKTVRENLTFPAVLSHYGIDGHGISDQVKIICPFHDDHKPSCGVNLVKHVYNCFACDAGGNALDFFAHMERLDPSKTAELRKAAFFAAEVFGIDYGLRCTLMGHKNTRPQYGDGGSLEYRRREMLKTVHPVTDDFAKSLANLSV